MVVSVDRGRYGCVVDRVVVTAMRARELGRRAVVVGDRVAIVGDVTGQTGTLARIVRVAPRTSVLRRSPDDADPVERVVVANAEVLVVVTALADPPPRPRLVDRCLVAAYDGKLTPLLCLTKGDLGADAGLAAAYRPLGVAVVTTGRDAAGSLGGLADLRAQLAGRTSVFFGQSGVGKSTLVNALVPAADRAVGMVNASTGRGRHTSSSAVALALPGSGWVIDTPGVRSFGLGHVTPARVLAAFADLAAGADGCPPGCSHAADAPDCALDAWVADGRAEPARLDSLRRLLAARDEPADSGELSSPAPLHGSTVPPERQ
jgi:ribosome biogenesis GTPase